MNGTIQNLIESIEKHLEAIRDEKIQKMDFDQLEKDLSEATSLLGSLEKKEKLCDSLLSDFKSEIRRMTLALSRTKGDLSSCGLVERLLLSPDLGFEDLLFLREKVREEFNQSFPATPQSKVIVNLVETNFKVSEFKTGVRG
jgi:hypothetical protein